MLDAVAANRMALELRIERDIPAPSASAGVANERHLIAGGFRTFGE
jgi:hypothetical protein